MQNRRTDALREIYDLYGDYSKDLTAACERGCSLCCTQDVTMTTLEGSPILEHLVKTGQRDLLAVFHSSSSHTRFSPSITTNDFAVYCFKGEDPPDDKSEQSGTPCGFLVNDECSIYAKRPFGCRCFFSSQACETEACAVVNPLLLTTNTVFLQFIEHIDDGGFFGNMNDVLVYLESEGKQGLRGASGDMNKSKSMELSLSLTSNRAIPALLIPPGHRDRMKEIVEKLQKIVIGSVREPIIRGLR